MEGTATITVEAILAGRPLVINPVVRALEVLSAGCVSANTDDVESPLQAVLQLATDGALYERKRAACATLKSQFYDRNFGLTKMLIRALSCDAEETSRTDTEGP